MAFNPNTLLRAIIVTNALNFPVFAIADVPHNHQQQICFYRNHPDLFVLVDVFKFELLFVKLNLPRGEGSLRGFLTLGSQFWRQQIVLVAANVEISREQVFQILSLRNADAGAIGPGPQNWSQ